MPVYTWEGRTRQGTTKKGVMEAENEEVVHNKLKLQLLQPVLVKKQPKQLSFQIGTGVKTEDIVIFTRLFATMIDAGLPISASTPRSSTSSSSTWSPPARRAASSTRSSTDSPRTWRRT